MTVFRGLLALMAGASMALSGVPAMAARLPTVRDAVEMAQFVRAEGENSPLYLAPGGRDAAFVLKRNDMGDMSMAYDLYVVHADLDGGRLRWGAPRRVHQVRTKSLVTSLTNSGVIEGISSVRWTPSGDALTFVSSDGPTWSLEVLKPGEAARKVYTSRETILRYAPAGHGWLVLSWRRDSVLRTPRVVANDMGTELGFPIPSMRGSTDLVVLGEGGELRRVPIPIARIFGGDNIWPSPDGRKVVFLMKPPAIPKSWEGYVSRIPTRGLKATAHNTDGTLSQYAVLDVESGTVRPLLDAPMAIQVLYDFTLPAVAWSKDSKLVAVVNTTLPLTSSSPDWWRTRSAVAVVRAEDGALQAVLPNPAIRKPDGLGSVGHLETLTRTKIGFEITGVDDAGRAVRLPIAEAGPSPPPPPVRSPPGELLAVSEALNDPPRLMAVSGGRSRALLDPNPQLGELRLSKTQVIHWRNLSGQDAVGGLVLPQDYAPGRRYPLVIQTHGLPLDRFMMEGYATTGYAAQALAARGMVVVQVAETASPEALDEGAQAVGGYIALIRKLAGEGLVDPDRVGIMGFSRTCYYVKWALANRAFPIAAAAVTDGIDAGYWNYLEVVGMPLGDDRSYVERWNGGKPWGPGLLEWAKHTPGFNLDKVEAPVRIEAIGDGGILTEWEWNAGLKRLGKPVEMVVLPPDTHVLATPAARMESSGGHVDWFDFWLNGHEDPDPAKAAQYERWRKLKALNRR